MSTIDPNHLEAEWKRSLDETPSVDRRSGFKDAVKEESWNNSYETGSENWKEYARGWDEGKKLLEKKSGKQAIREAFLDLLTFTPHYTPESEYYDVEDRVPFFTETYLYALVGKDDARTILAYLRSLMEACDFERRELEEQVVRMED